MSLSSLLQLAWSGHHARTAIVYGLWSAAFLFIAQAGIAQLIDKDESKLYAESKQINQFFRRFNGEEDEKGNRHHPGDKPYRSEKLRRKYLAILFDEGNAGMPNELKVQFAKSVIEKPLFLDFHAPGWFAEAQSTFTIAGRNQPVTLFMELEKDHLGYKWVISRVRVPAFDQYFERDTVRVGRFLHPMSHELEFMNLRKAFADTDSLTQFTVKRYRPDYLSLFLYELKKGDIKFQSVERVKFHFFQADGWYFELANFNRAGFNSGWLISSLVRLNSDADKQVMERHLYETQ